MPDGGRPLLRAFSACRDIPHVSLGTFPTPVDAIDLTSVLSSFRGRAWVKREDLCSDEVGGNKVRKLEYLLAHAQKQDRRTLLTMGGIGSNHCLAAAFWGPEAGLDVELVIFPHAVSPTSRRTLRAICALGPRITYAPGATALPAVVAARWGALTARGARPYLVTPGGSTVRGTLGFVEAGLELARQVAEGALETPDTVYCAYSSGGTAAGLAVGLQLGGLRTNVVGVRVYPAPLASTRAVRWLARRTYQRVGAASGFDPSLLHAPGAYLGAGYAEPTPASSAAQEVAEDLGFALDPTYTAKAFAAFLDAAASPGGRDAKLVFVLTYDGQSARRLADEATDPTRVPGPLRRYL